LLDRIDRAAHQVIGIERFAAIIAAQFTRGVGKQCKAGNAKRNCLSCAGHDQVNRPARNARQRTDRFLAAFALGDKQRPDQIRRSKLGFTV
jgi:hypothetical protein